MASQTPKSVALVGRPNVGKSRLFNRILGRRVSIVHDKPDMFYAAAIGKNSEFLYKDEQVLKLIEEGVKKFSSDKRAKQVQDKIDAAKK